MDKIEYVGDINNWMDFKDLLLKTIKKCDTELKLNSFINSIILSIGVSPEGMNEVRKANDIKPFSKEDMEKLKEVFNNG